MPKYWTNKSNQAKRGLFVWPALILSVGILALVVTVKSQTPSHALERGTTGQEKFLSRQDVGSLSPSAKPYALATADEVKAACESSPGDIKEAAYRFTKPLGSIFSPVVRFASKVH